MAARKRKPGESFERYRENLKREEKIVSTGIAIGRMFHLSPKKGKPYVKPKVSVMEASHGL